MNRRQQDMAELMANELKDCLVCHDRFQAEKMRVVIKDKVVQWVCPGCIQNVPRAERSSMSVQEIQAWKHGRAVQLSSKTERLNAKSEQEVKA